MQVIPAPLQKVRKNEEPGYPLRSKVPEGTNKYPFQKTESSDILNWNGYKVLSFQHVVTFLIGISTLLCLARPLQGQDLRSILKNQAPAKESPNPRSEQPNEGFSDPSRPTTPKASLDIPRGVPQQIVRIPRDPLEPYLWNIQMAEMSFALNNDATSYGRLVTARIHLVEAACLKPLLDGTGAAPTEHCINVRELVLNDFTNAPAAVCARDGMNSPTCKEAHFKLPLEDFKYFPTQKEKAENDFMGITDPTQKINTLSIELSSVLYNTDQTSKEKAEESTVKAFALGARILKLACAEESYAVLPLNRKKEAKQEKIEILKIERSTPIVPRTVATPTISPDEPPVIFRPIEFELVRLINQQCRDQIRALKDRIPGAASLVCAEQGRFSPACQDAVKAEDAKYKKKGKPVEGRSASNPEDPNQKIFKSF